MQVDHELPERAVLQTAEAIRRVRHTAALPAPYLNE